MLGVFRNTLTANDKYRVRHFESSLSPIQMKLSLKPKAFPDFFPYFWNLHQILNVLKKKKIIIVIAFLLRNLQAVKDLVRLHSEKHCFRTPFDSQHFKDSQNLYQI